MKAFGAVLVVRVPGRRSQHTSLPPSAMPEVCRFRQGSTSSKFMPRTGCFPFQPRDQKLILIKGI